MNLLVPTGQTFVWDSHGCPWISVHGGHRRKSGGSYLQVRESKTDFYVCAWNEMVPPTESGRPSQGSLRGLFSQEKASWAPGSSREVRALCPNPTPTPRARQAESRELGKFCGSCGWPQDTVPLIISTSPPMVSADLVLGHL